MLTTHTDNLETVVRLGHAAMARERPTCCPARPRPWASATFRGQNKIRCTIIPTARKFSTSSKVPANTCSIRNGSRSARLRRPHPGQHEAQADQRRRRHDDHADRILVRRSPNRFPGVISHSPPLRRVHSRRNGGLYGVSMSLDLFFRPKSVAVVGASATPGSVGSILMRNLLENPFGGVVFPSTRNARRFMASAAIRRCWRCRKPSISPSSPPPRPRCPATIEECVARGVPAAIVISAGFSELGAEGRALEKQIRRHRPRQDAHRRPELPRHHPSVERPERELRVVDGRSRAASPC